MCKAHRLGIKRNYGNSETRPFTPLRLWVCVPVFIRGRRNVQSNSRANTGTWSQANQKMVVRKTASMGVAPLILNSGDSGRETPPSLWYQRRPTSSRTPSGPTTSRCTTPAVTSIVSPGWQLCVVPDVVTSILPSRHSSRAEKSCAWESLTVPGSQVRSSNV